MFPIRDDRPTYSAPIITTILIAVNVLVFLFELSLDEYSRNYFIAHFGLIPARFHFSRVITSMFLHGGWLHVIGNMIFLWAFGRSLEDAMGHGKFFGFYMLCGIAAGLTQVFFNFDSRVPTVGASGAIAGVMGAYLIKFPTARIDTLVFVFFFITRVDIPAMFILLYWFVTQIFNGVGTIGYSHLSQGGTAWFAHIGGFVAGMALIKVLGTQNRFYRRRDVYW